MSMGALRGEQHGNAESGIFYHDALEQVVGFLCPFAPKTVFTDTLTEALGKYDFIVTNFANGDVIGHTQNTEAKLKACAYVSQALEKVVGDALSKGYATIS